MSRPTISPVQFHDSILYIINHNGEPFTPMKPIVENMGLQWAAQTVKLNVNKERWGVSMIEIPSDGGPQQTLCMPVRKLPAFMASINPKKVREELRERIRPYQDECDNALWDYWTKGQATRRRRKPAQKALPKPSTPAYPRFTPRTTLEEIEARLTTLCLHVKKERFSIYTDLLNQFCNTYTPRVVPADVVCSSVSNAIYSLINDCLLRAGDNPLQFDNPCKFVREVRDMLEECLAAWIYLRGNEDGENANAPQQPDRGAVLSGTAQRATVPAHGRGAGVALRRNRGLRHGAWRIPRQRQRVFGDVLEIKDAGEAMEQLFPWILHMIRTAEPEDVEADAEDMVSQLRRAGMCSPDLDWKLLAKGDFQQIDILLTCDDNFREHLVNRMGVHDVEYN